MSPNMPRLYLSALAFLGLLVQSSYAMPDDKDKRVELSANFADLNQQTHQGAYEGNVQLDQGTTHLRASNANTKGNKQNKLVFAVACGDKFHQAHYWAQTDKDKPLLHAYADIMKYYPNQHLIVLIGNAKVLQGSNSFAAPKISYDTLHQHIVSNSKGRVTIIIHPENKHD